MYRREKGISLVESVVVIVVVALLLCIALPVLGLQNNHAKNTLCMANLRNLSMAWVEYYQDNDGKLVNSFVTHYNSWVNIPRDDSGNSTGHDSTVEEKINGIESGDLYPYTQNAEIYHCPMDFRYKTRVRSRGAGGYRSYSMSEGIGIPNSARNITSISGTVFSIHSSTEFDEIAEPSSKYILVEENYTHGPATPATNPPDMGFSGGAWVIWKGNLSEAWWDPLAGWHDLGMNLGYADGHVELRRWKDQRTIWYANDRLDPRLGSSGLECALQPGNPDQIYMTKHSPYRIEELD